MIAQITSLVYIADEGRAYAHHANNPARSPNLLRVEVVIKLLL